MFEDKRAREMPLTSPASSKHSSSIVLQFSTQLSFHQFSSTPNPIKMDPNILAQWKVLQEMELPKPSTSFEGKTVIVTGSNTGLGLEAARHFVACKASRVILAVRSEAKGEAAKADIEASTGITGVAEVWLLDMSSYSSIRSFVERVQKLDRVDTVLQNAGLAMGTRVLAEGTETQMTVNIYGTFLLAFLLIPKLKETAKKFETQPSLNIVASNSGFMLPFTERKNDYVLETLDNHESLPAVYATHSPAS
jgi:retinol dehydrogenase 12